VFSGRYEHAIDGKGRTSLPSRFREVLAASGDARIVITAGLDGCLVVYPMQGWLAFQEQLAKLSQFDPAVVMLRRVHVSSAEECELDKLGRVLIPAALRKHAGLTRNLWWAGMGKNIELWDKQRFEQLRDEVLADPEEKLAMAKRLAELGL
jgi:MraZ protein